MTGFCHIKDGTNSESRKSCCSLTLVSRRCICKHWRCSQLPLGRDYGKQRSKVSFCFCCSIFGELVLGAAVAWGQLTESFQRVREAAATKTECCLPGGQLVSLERSMNSRVLFISLYRSSLWKLVLILMTWKSKRLSYLRDLILGIWKKKLFFLKKGEACFALILSCQL